MGDKTADAWKEEGNAAFRDGDWDLALARYSKALALAKDDGERAVCLKNRAAAHLKRQDHEAALSDCSAALELAPGDPKALYRRCQALEALGRPEEAYRDAKQVLAADPANRSVQPLLQRLFRAVEARAAESAQTGNKVARMFRHVFGPGEDPDKRRTAANNLVVLAREKAGAELMYREGVVGQAGRLVRTEQDQVVYLACVRVVGELCRGHLERTRGVLQELGMPWFLDVLNCGDEERVNAAQCCLQTLLNTLSGMDGKPDGKPRKELCEQNGKEIDTLLTCLVYSTTNRTFTGLARDAVIELITRNVHYTALDWSERLVAIGGLQRLLEVCSELEEYKYESAMEITASTRTLASVCLARIYENMYYDAARERFLAAVDGFVKEKLVSPDIESKVRVTVALTSLLLGPLDVGDSVIAREGIMEMILVMAGTDDRLQQKVACECIIAAASKKDKARPLIAHGAEVLKKLYQSKDDGIRVRALVGLCKLGSSGGTDASVRPFADGSTTKLAEACRRFLVNPAKDKDMRKWAVEGLSYLTLDAEVKEKLVADRPALQALVELGRTGDHSVVYGVATTLVNLVNAYEKQELAPEMVELAKYAKHHIPEEHELDDPDFVSNRVTVLAKEGVTSALVAMARTESPNSRELIARVLNAVCAEKELRGLVVQHGGAKALLPLALDGTDKGRKQAAQALARIGITINPEVAFPGQRCVEVVRPLLSLLHQDCSALENFEALLALCNLASVSETVRQRIVKEGGVSLVESYMYEEHEMLRRAATQVMTNLAACPDVVRLYEGPGDRAKFLVLLCADEDEETCAAAAGALATLAAQSRKLCRKVLQAQTWLDSLHHLLLSPDAGLQHRGVALVAHMMRSSKAVAEKLIGTDVMEILLALSVLKEEGREKVSALAAEALQAAESWKLIKKPGEDDDEDLE
ncbi:protein unc-45 homolog A [Bacillus rossius redtenbacheri]|uniref:protein unc-45 homolog A n=1 Tax=Bacillus rossius redtenbacheri TaxID=93214 RepID=UPI002FDCB8A8